MDIILDFFRRYPEMAIFLTIGIGFWVGQLKYKTFSLGTVTSVLLVGVLVGQMDIPIPGPLKSVFFLIFLFIIGYSVGPQFFQSLRSSGIKQVGFAVVLCLLCLVITVAIGKILGYNPGETVGLFSGAQTISAVIGVGSDTISTLSASQADKTAWMNIIPVCYAVTYIYGTIGSAYILGTIAPKMLGGIDKVKKQTKELEESLKASDLSKDPAYINANRPVVFRAYSIDGEWFNTPRTITELEAEFQNRGRRIFVERIRQNGTIKDPLPVDTLLQKGDEVVLSGRREMVIQDESWIGPEVNDADLLIFPVESLSVLISAKDMSGIKIDQLRANTYMHGIIIQSLKRAGVNLPVLPGTEIMHGDTMEIVGLSREVKNAIPHLGYPDRLTNKTDLVFVGLGILIGGIIGALTVHIGGIPISLSTSGGALIAGLFFGWLRTKHPTFGRVPESAVWLLNNLGLNMFIAVIGITAGPTFMDGIRQVGFMLFIAGILATSLPLIIGVWIGDKWFKFHPAINLGCNAGSRTTTAALGAIQDALDSSLPALGYTVTYAVGNTLLILWGVVIVLLMS